MLAHDAPKLSLKKTKKDDAYSSISFSFHETQKKICFSLSMISIDAAFLKNYEIFMEPNLIRFDHLLEDAIMEITRQGPNVRERYVRDPEYLQIDAQHATQFLQTLLKATEITKGKFKIEDGMLHKLVSELIKDNYITDTQGAEYLKQIPTIKTLESRSNLAVETKNFKELFLLAEDYLNSDALFPANASIYHLVEAIKAKPKADDISKYINLDEYLKSFTTLDNGYIFSDTDPSLLDALKRNSTITTLQLGIMGTSLEYLNSYFADYVSATKSLKTLDLHGNMGCRINDDQIQTLCQGLKFNTSIETLDLNDRSLLDKGLILLLEALEQNPQIKLKSLNLFSTGISDVGANRLIEYLKTHSSIESINLGYNNLPKNIIDEVDKLTKANEESNTKNPASGSNLHAFFKTTTEQHDSIEGQKSILQP